MTIAPKPVRLAIVADFPEEGWESMDLVAEMILGTLNQRDDLGISARNITPRYVKCFQCFVKKRWAWNLDRLINRRFVLVRGVRKALKSGQFDAVYVVDHSYAHVVGAIKKQGLPCVVLCHDLDAFGSLAQVSKGWRNRCRRWFARPIWRGLLMADMIFTGSETVRHDLLALAGSRYDPARVFTNTYGVAPEFVAGAEVDSGHLEILDTLPGPLVVHVGSTIPRKRIDVLLGAVAKLGQAYADVRLVRVGGRLNTEQRKMAEALGVWERLIELPRLTRAEVAEVYRRADVVLVTSDAEGFGLPVIEALACGAGVVVSDLPVLREPGGCFVEYAAVGDTSDFARCAAGVIQTSRPEVMEQALVEHLSRFRWSSHVERLGNVLKRFCLR
jgi:glycosyltransferase involved in cell wall biosynthesis